MNYRNLDEKNKEIMQLAIDSKVESIIEELGLVKSNDPVVQLKNCGLVQKYIVEHNTNNPNMLDDRDGLTLEDTRLLDSYDGLINNIGSNIAMAETFKNITERVGIESEIVLSQNKESKREEASNLVKLGEKYYFFDSSLERQLYENYQEESSFHLCAAGLGKEYLDFFQPMRLLPKNESGFPNPIPYNIAEKRIEPQAVDALTRENSGVVR